MIDNVIQNITQIIYLDYVASVILTVFILLKFVKKESSQTFRIRANILVGVIYLFAFIYYDYQNYNPVNLFVSFLTTVAFYQWLLRSFMKIFNIKYDKS